MNPLWIRLRGALALCGTVLVALALSACATPAAAPPPKLVVLIAIDGLPMWQVTAYRDQLAPDGLARFLERGAWYADAHHGHADRRLPAAQRHHRQPVARPADRAA